MQKNLKILSVIAVVVCLATIGTGFAYADNSTQPTQGQTTSITIGVNAGAAVASGGIGALSGVLLAVVTAWNQNMTQTGTTKISPREFGILIALGFAVGLVLQTIGLNPTTNTTVTSGVIMAVATLANYGALHIANMTLRPLFNHWITGAKGNAPSSSQTKSSANTDVPAQS